MTVTVNPRIIKWARERSGLSVENLAALLHKNINEIHCWEAGTKNPSYTQLEDMAYRHFKIPVALFFFPEPPNIEDAKNIFRRLPEYELERFSSDTLHMIRLAQGYQESLAELTFGQPRGRNTIHDLGKKEFTVRQLAENTRDYLEISVRGTVQISKFRPRTEKMA